MMSFERLEPRRLLAAGDLDPLFGSGGILDIDLTHPLLGAQRVVPIDNGTGEFLVIGQEIRRFKPSGVPDLTFGGGDGVMLLPDDLIAANDYIENAAVLPDGKVLAVVRQQRGDQVLHQMFAFNADGTPTGVQLPVGLGEVDQFVVQPDGRVLAVGASQTLRFLPDLQFDPTFGQNGLTPPLLHSAAMDVAPDGSLYAVGMNQQTPPKKVIVKFTADGAVDASFGSNGEVVTTDTTDTPVTELEVEPTGTLLTVIAGRINRLKLDGQFDEGFGVGGVLDPRFGEIAPAPTELTLVPGGKILVTQGGGVTRLNPDGMPDVTYGRVVASQSGRGTLGVNEWGEVYFTAAGTTRTLALHRLAADSAETGPIHLDRETGELFVIGTDNADEMRASRQGTDLVIMRNRFDVSRVFAPQEITLLNFQGLGGNDFITLASAGYFRTTVSGGDGNDKILGCDGPDSVSGNAGKDFISGGNGADRLAGNGGRDKLLGEGGNDRLYGGASGDWLLGAGGNDQLFGEGGNDHIQGGSGNDTLDGSAGDDLLISNDGSIDSPGWVDYLFGDGGKDSSVADASDILSSIEYKLTAMPY